MTQRSARLNPAVDGENQLPAVHGGLRGEFPVETRPTRAPMLQVPVSSGTYPLACRTEVPRAGLFAVRSATARLPLADSGSRCFLTGGGHLSVTCVRAAVSVRRVVSFHHCCEDAA